jgi:hypothetical protein
MSLVPLFSGVGISIVIVVDRSGRRSSQQFGQSLSHSLYLLYFRTSAKGLASYNQSCSMAIDIPEALFKCVTFRDHASESRSICHEDSIVPGPVSSIGPGACYMDIAHKLLEYVRGRLRARQQRSAKSSAQFEHFRRSECLLVSGDLSCCRISLVGLELFTLVWAVGCSLAVKTWCRRAYAMDMHRHGPSEQGSLDFEEARVIAHLTLRHCFDGQEISPNGASMRGPFHMRE